MSVDGVRCSCYVCVYVRFDLHAWLGQVLQDLIRGAGRHYQLSKSGHGNGHGSVSFGGGCQKPMGERGGELEEALKMGPVY